MIKVIVLGAAGKMGSNILKLVDDDSELELIGAVERADCPFIGEDASRFGGTRGVKITGSLAEIADKDTVIIDFTHIDATRENIKIASEKSSPMVIGTTGWSMEEVKNIEELAKKSFPCLLSPNMSLGVNVLFKLVYEAAKLLTDEYNVEIIEIHHRMKKDAPSGTAVKLGQVVAEAFDWNYDEVAVYERKGIIGERKKKEIGIQTLRAGDVVGEHTVIFGGMGERIELTHKAHSRENFARGAIRAAKWIYNKPNGFYNMKDVLGI